MFKTILLLICFSMNLLAGSIPEGNQEEQITPKKELVSLKAIELKTERPLTPIYKGTRLLKRIPCTFGFEFSLNIRPFQGEEVPQFLTLSSFVNPSTHPLISRAPPT